MYEDEVLNRIKKIKLENSDASDIELCMCLIDDSDEISLSKQKSLDKSEFIVWKEMTLPIYAFYINEVILPENITGMKIYAGVKRAFVNEYLSPGLT
jgi:hypothetical protein